MTPAQLRHTEDTTLDFYEASAEQYFRTTVDLRLDILWEQFLAAVRPGGVILDAGSGSGRDTREFMARGFAVDAFDASPTLAALSSRLTGQATKIATFEAWSGPVARYDGVWAFASLLHVARARLPAVLRKLALSMKPQAVLLASFKSGVTDLVDGRGRRFTNLTPSAAAQLFNDQPDFEQVEVWSENAPAAHGEITAWVYVMARRTSL